jgi:hypothetical protein
MNIHTYWIITFYVASYAKEQSSWRFIIDSDHQRGPRTVHQPYRTSAVLDARRGTVRTLLSLCSKQSSEFLDGVNMVVVRREGNFERGD